MDVRAWSSIDIESWGDDGQAWAQMAVDGDNRAHAVHPIHPPPRLKG